ncbi:MAG: efflux RND transporter periplasmic adaptor subunit [Candidatus Binatia bacterium]
MRRAVVVAILLVLAACERGDPTEHGEAVAPPATAAVPGVATESAVTATVHDVRHAPVTVVGDGEPPEVRDARRELLEAEARERQAAQQAARLEGLSKGAVAPAKDLEAARADAAAAAATAGRARQALAAFGTAVAQQPLAAGERWAIAQVAQRDLALIASGGAATLVADAFPGRTFAARVDAAAAYVDPATRAAPVRLRVADPEGVLRPGMSGAVAIEMGAARQAVVVPAAAVVYDAAQPVVFVAGAERYSARPVRLGVAVDGRVEIVDGIAAGTPIVTTGAASLLSAARLPAEAD